MERLESINVDRVLWCAAERGIALDDLAAEAGLSARALTRLREKGGGLTYPQLKKLADFFGRGALFFLEEGPVKAAQVHTVQYRTLTNQKPDLAPAMRNLIERVERQRELYLALREDLHAEDYPVFQFPPRMPTKASEAAAWTRTWLHLGETNTFDEYRAKVEAKGLLVFRSNGYAGRWQFAKDSPVLGFSLFSDTCPVIVVRKSRAEAQQTFTLMHELGHLLLHRESSIDDDADLYSRVGHERDANAFAGHLLVPAAFLDQIPQGTQPQQAAQFDAWLAPLRKRWGVSTEVILRRLMDTGRLSEERYAAYRTHVRQLVDAEEDAGGSRAYRHREPKHIFGDRFVKTVLSALSDRKITATKACSYLDGLKLSDLHSLERHVAGT